MSYLDLVEEFPKDFKSTMFEKVLMATRRAKDLHKGADPLFHAFHSDTYLALEEISRGMIKLEYQVDTTQAALGQGANQDEDEDEV
ncbi:MAG: DNA-directed RNA polymerase subunit omega [Deltaproteobacteria bacterium]|nr:DNA-directed RNA polymerase subunit omega [Deltaproteobacteria bacterium]